MRISQERLIFLALAVVKEAALACRPAPLTPSLGLQLALSFLWAHSKGPRFPYDDFWKAVRDPGSPDKHESMRQYLRTTNADSGLKGIIRSVGMPETVEFDQFLRVAAGTKEDRDRYRMSQAFKQVIEEKRLHDEWKRSKRQCTLRG